MSGRALDVTFVLVVAVLWVGVAVFSPGVGNLLVAWFGMVGFGYYNSLVRRNPKDDSLRPRWR